MHTPRKYSDDIKLVCDHCGRFAGWICTDGTGPQHEECLADDGRHVDGHRINRTKCPIVDICEQFIPVPRPTNVGRGRGPREDMTGIGNIIDAKEQQE